MTIEQMRLFIAYLQHLEREKQRHIEAFRRQYEGVIGKRKAEAA